ncbi:MAG: DUF4329 domain-containing protein [Saccharofermentanales bacterium]
MKTVYVAALLFLMLNAGCSVQGPTQVTPAKSMLQETLKEDRELIFDTIDEAARDFALRYNAQSISEDKEYASVIFQVKVKVRTYIHVTRRFLWWSWQRRITKTTKVIKYSYTRIRAGSTHSLLVPFAPPFHKKVAEIHSHGAYNEGFENDVFSPQDKNAFINYLVTPLGTLRKYNPAEGSDIELYDDLPFDPNHPGR